MACLLYSEIETKILFSMEIDFIYLVILLKIQNVIVIDIDAKLRCNGPATHVAAIYAATSNLNPLVILQPSNYPITGLDTIPGIPQEISATDYLALLKKQAERFKVTFVESSVTDIHCDSIIKVSTTDKTYITKTVILDDINLCKEMFTANMFQDGKVICEDNSSQCAIQGVYVCGSAREKYDDAIVLCGSGCMAALDAKEYIESTF